MKHLFSMFKLNSLTDKSNVDIIVDIYYNNSYSNHSKSEVMEGAQ